MVPDRVSQLFLMFLLKQHYVEIVFLCHLAHPTVSGCNTTVLCVEILYLEVNVYEVTKCRNR